jgi:N-acetylmuramoyl-L-alanine amidase
MKKMKPILILLIGVLVCAHSPLTTKGTKIRKVVIDAGHGGKDPGCSGKQSQEKDVAFEIAMELGALIKQYQPEVEVIYTRKSKDEFVELNERARIANKAGADVFISIHCNANPVKSIEGTETYILGIGNNENNFDVAMRENSAIFHEDNHQHHYAGFDPNSPASYILLANYQHAFKQSSLSLASKIEKEFADRQKRVSRGVKQSAFLVLAKTAMPAVLVETGFLSNTDDEKYLNSRLGKSFTATSIYRAFRNYKNELEKVQ